jgi:hypothetical protein
VNVKNKTGVTFKELIFCPAFIFAEAVLFDRKSTHDTQRRIVHGINRAGNNAAARFMPESNAAVV